MNDFAAKHSVADNAVSSRPRHLLALASAIACLSMASLAEAAAPETAMTKLIRGLMQSGALTRDVGDALLAEAQAEAQAAPPHNAVAPVAAAPTAGGMQTQPGDVRVSYLSPKAREQIRNEVKNEVMAQAKAEGWAAPNAMPEWTQRVRVETDLRVRNESRLFSGNNSNIEIDWGKINGGSGYDVNPNTNLSLPPLLNTREDRNNLWRLRARVGVLADISERTKAGVRLATGSDNNPVSTNQTLGGGLSKKNVWLDQGWVSHQPADWVKITAGRFGNPFMSTDTLFSNDLNFDGVAAQFDHDGFGSDTRVFGTLGYIPLEYSSDNFPGTSQDKMESKNKWLLGTQAGLDWKINDTNQLRGALAYYDFHNISGKLSDPCALYAGEDHCSTDWSRPDFMQKGNTLMMLRNIALDPLDPANTKMPQYVGLASKFELVDLNVRWDTTVVKGLGLRLELDYIRNLAFGENDIWKRGAGGIVNNFSGTGGTSRSDFESGGDAYMLQALLGNVNLKTRGDWNVLFGYKYIEPDALPDGYNDSTFHLGGTNAKGYYLGGSYAFDKNTWVSGRWFATKEVYGAPLSIDILQLELNTRF